MCGFLLKSTSISSALLQLPLTTTPPMERCFLPMQRPTAEGPSVRPPMHGIHEHFRHAPSTSKSNTINLVSSVPFREPTAQISFVSLALKVVEDWGRRKVNKLVGRTFSYIAKSTHLILHTTPPDPPDSSATRFRMKSPVFTSHNLTVPSSELVITKRELNCKQVTADWCLFGPAREKKKP